MFRSMVGILLLINLNIGLTEDQTSQPVFDAVNLLHVAPIPAKNQDTIQPDIKAKAALLMDIDSGIVLYENNSHASLPIASLTKIMTAILILESHNLNEIVTIKDDFSGLEGVKIDLYQYESMTIEDLLIGLLVRSGGDAAIALAKHHSNSVEKFVAEMNQKAKMLNLYNTNFMNPVGLDDSKHYSSAFDLAILTKYALHNSHFRQIIRLNRATITSVDGKITHKFKNTNKLLNNEYLNILGVKTGTTDEAGESIINLARNSKGQEIITVLLNSPDRFQESKSLLDWAFRNYSW